VVCLTVQYTNIKILAKIGAFGQPRADGHISMAGEQLDMISFAKTFRVLYAYDLRWSSKIFRGLDL
jgi:hypothetical protein